MLALSCSLIAKTRSNQALEPPIFIIYMSPPKYFRLVAIFLNFFRRTYVYTCVSKNWLRRSLGTLLSRGFFQSASSWCVQGVIAL